MPGRTITLQVNGSAATAHDVGPNVRLVDLLRDRLDLTGTKQGCETGHCGACSVLLDGDLVCSCLVLALECDGATVTSIEGVAGEDGALHPVQEAFAASAGVQCGFCTPGFVMASLALLDGQPQPDEAACRQALAGNICRCSGGAGYARALAGGLGSRQEGDGR